MTSVTPAEQLEAVPVPMFRRSVANLVALGCIQLANALLPLVAYPFILGIVGAHNFSRVVVTETVMMAVLALVIYSFDEVTHAFNEEEPMLVAIAAVVLEFPNSSKSGSNV